MEHLIETLEGFGPTPVVLVGDFMLDEYVYGHVDRISPEAPVPVFRAVRREFRCGGAGNAALALAALGAKVLCVGVVGDDPAGQDAIAKLVEAGCDCSGIVSVSERPTTIKRRYVGLAQHRHAQQILRVDEEYSEPLHGDLRATLTGLLSERLASAAVLGLEDYGKGVVTDVTGPEWIQLADTAGKPSVVDPHPTAPAGRYRGASLLTPNRYEARLLAGADEGAELPSTARGVLERTSGRAVAITLDKEGAYLLQAGQSEGQWIPTRPRNVYDVTGAGDVVMATLMLAVAGGVDLHEAVALANVAGGLEVERFGVVAVTKDEIVAELRHELGVRGSKVRPRQALAAELERRRSQGGERVVFTNGCFDLMHLGHVSYLQQARELGTCLVVAINSDASVRRLKGPSRPVIDEDERGKMLAALECVDYVTVFDEDTPDALLELLRPDMLVKGGSTGVIVGQEFVESYGGQVERLDLIEGRSTTEIINHILSVHDREAKEAGDGD